MFWLYLGCSLLLVTAIPCMMMARRPELRPAVYAVSQGVCVVSAASLGFCEANIRFDLRWFSTPALHTMSSIAAALLLASAVSVAVGRYYQAFWEEP